jgi:peptide/nickel transport system substrate-binding protein
VRASSLEEQKKIAADIQREVYDQVIYPDRRISRRRCLAEIALRRARRSGPVFWNIDKSD